MLGRISRCSRREPLRERWIRARRTRRSSNRSTPRMSRRTSEETGGEGMMTGLLLLLAFAALAAGVVRGREMAAAVAGADPDRRARRAGCGARRCCWDAGFGMAERVSARRRAAASAARWRERAVSRAAGGGRRRGGGVCAGVLVGPALPGLRAARSGVVERAGAEHGAGADGRPTDCIFSSPGRCSRSARIS